MNTPTLPISQRHIDLFKIISLLKPKVRILARAATVKQLPPFLFWRCSNFNFLEFSCKHFDHGVKISYKLHIDETIATFSQLVENNAEPAAVLLWHGVCLNHNTDNDNFGASPAQD